MSFLVNAFKHTTQHNHHHHQNNNNDPNDNIQNLRDKLSSGKSAARARAVYLTQPPVPITCHAFNNTATQVAVSRANSSDVEILQISPPLSTTANNNTHARASIAPTTSAATSSWPVISTLKAHDLRVTGIDWAPKSNRIVTCSADRNAYVWTPETASTADGGADGGAIQWKKALVLLRTNRAATCVKWSPQENKFAIGCGSKLVSVCYFEEENDWWLSKHIKKPLKSTVTCVDWHPNNSYLAVGSSDFRARVYSAYVKDVDSRPDLKDPHNALWGEDNQFGNVMAEYSSLCWIHAIKFCRFANGDRLLWIAHDCTLNIVDAAAQSGLQRVIVCRTKYLPFYAVQWLSASLIMTAGHDCAPHLYLYDAGAAASSTTTNQRHSNGGEAIVHLCTLDKATDEHNDDGIIANGGANASAGATENGGIDERSNNGVSALKKFRDLDLKASNDADDTSLPSYHQNTITNLSVLPNADINSGKSNNSVVSFATSGQDGMLILWQLPI